MRGDAEGVAHGTTIRPGCDQAPPSSRGRRSAQREPIHGRTEAAGSAALTRSHASSDEVSWQYPPQTIRGHQSNSQRGGHGRMGSCCFFHEAEGEQKEGLAHTERPAS